MDDELEESMSTKEAIEHAADYFSVPSMYAMAKALSDENLKVQPIQISKYRTKGVKMSKRVARRFFDTYGITVNDSTNKGVWEQ